LAEGNLAHILGPKAIYPLVSRLDFESTVAVCVRPDVRRSSFASFAERVAGGVLLALASPVLAPAAVVAGVLSRRSPFVAHLRVGKGGASFWVLKLRTMWQRQREPKIAWGFVERIVAEPASDWKDASDPRVTSRFAAFCRRHSIDELPQLWHVVRGEMSLVGPRPLTRGEIERHYAMHAAELLSIAPGLTGLWQVGGRSEIGFCERVDLDLELVRTLDTKMYFRILARTLPAVVYGKGAW